MENMKINGREPKVYGGNNRIRYFNRSEEILLYTLLDMSKQMVTSTPVWLSL